MIIYVFNNIPKENSEQYGYYRARKSILSAFSSLFSFKLPTFFIHENTQKWKI